MLVRLRRARRLSQIKYRLALDLVDEERTPWDPGDCVVQIDLLDGTKHESVPRGLLVPAFELYRLSPHDPPDSAESRLLRQIGQVVDQYVGHLFEGEFSARLSRVLLTSRRRACDESIQGEAPMKKRVRPRGPSDAKKRVRGTLPLPYLARTRYRDLDYGIRPLVKLLYEAELRPFSSCSGHGQRVPWVALRGGRKEARRAARALLQAGYFEFGVAVQRLHSRRWPRVNGLRSVRITIESPLRHARSRPHNDHGTRG